jgi:transcriptional regulator with XRE-family HTH domain
MARAAHGRGKSRVGRGSKAPHRAFAARLVGLRASAGFTQAELAGRLGASRRQIAYYESGRGRPPGALLGLLADLFRVSTDSLLGRESLRTSARLSSAVLARLREIERMGADVGRRLEATLDQFVVAEEWRRHPTRARGLHSPVRARAANGRRAPGASRARR